MKINQIFFNTSGRLRSLWRLAVYVTACLFSLPLLFAVTEYVLIHSMPQQLYKSLFVEGSLGFITQSFLIFAPAALFGWICSRAFEGLPWRALGWALHRGWMADALKGLLVGAVSLGVAAAIGVALGGCRLTAPAHFDLVAIARTFIVSGFIFALGAAAEEMLFRGYFLQTLMRSWIIWLALVPSSIAFALVHMGNPNVVPAFSFVNTLLAGVWLAIAYWRTRSLWLALGIHWGWNWMQGAVIGAPVSGITKIAPDPLMHFADYGPAWIGGGAYGIEGGAACTLALLISMLFIWRTRLFSSKPEMKKFTDGENPYATPSTAKSAMPDEERAV